MNTMRIAKPLFLSAVVALGLAPLARAQTYVRIVAAQAFRQPVNAAISHILKPGFTVGYQGTDVTVALQAVYTGTTSQGNIPVIIKTSYGTSTNAIRSLVSNLTTNAYLVDTASGPNQATFETGATSDVALSGEFQATTRYPSPALADYVVGVGPYLWVRSAGAPGSVNAQTLTVSTTNNSANATTTSTAGLVVNEMISGNANIPTGAYIASISNDGVSLTLSTVASGTGAASTSFNYLGLSNINDALARNILTNGQILLSQFTGSAGDAPITVTVAGRDEGASSREVLFAECGFGTFSDPFQYQISVSGNAVSGSIPYPGPVTVDGFTYTLSGHSGYTTFKSLATALNTPNNNPGSYGWFVGYLDPPDAALVNNGNNIMTWNGVTYSPAAVQQGQYTYWSYFHWLYRTDFNTTSPTAKQVADLIGKQVHDNDASAGGAGILLSTMQVSRAVDGGDVTVGKIYP